MEFKSLLVCFSLLVLTTSAASVCKCGPETKKASVSKYTVKVNEGGKEVDQEIEIDTEEETEKMRIPNGPASETGEVYIIYDFKKGMTIRRISNPTVKACYLSKSTGNIPKPEDMTALLDQENEEGPMQANVNETDVIDEYRVVGKVEDRSVLSDDMANLCAKLSIYRVELRSGVSMTVEKRVKRDRCIHHCYRECWLIFIFCKRDCITMC